MHRALLAFLLGAQSIAFYHDTLGFELTGSAGEHRFTDNPAVANLYGVPGKQFRAAVLKIPESAMGMELVQWRSANAEGPAGLRTWHSDPDHSGRRIIVRDPNGFYLQPMEMR